MKITHQQYIEPLTSSMIKYCGFQYVVFEITFQMFLGVLFI